MPALATTNDKSGMSKTDHQLTSELSSAIQDKSRFVSTSVLLLLLIGLIFSAKVQAYTFPGDLPQGCSGSNGNYTCTKNLDIKENVTFNDTGYVTINMVNNTFKVDGNYTIGSASQMADVTFNFLSSSKDIKVVLKQSATVYANFSLHTTSSSQKNIAITFTNDSVVHGDIWASSGGDGAFAFKQNLVINGNVYLYGTTSATITMNKSAVINGSVSATSDSSNAVKVELISNTTKITGNVKSHGVIKNNGRINGCAQITDTSSSAQLYLSSGSYTAAICKGEIGACQPSDDYLNNDTETTPPNCTEIVKNLALNKPATQSSTQYSGSASRAVDGNIDGTFSNNSVTHTADASNNWWQVDLQAAYNLDEVNIFNRTDCCSEYLSDFYVFVSETDLTGRSFSDILSDSSVTKTYIPSQAPSRLNLSNVGTGRYIRVQINDNGNQQLSIAEMQAFGTKVASLVAEYHLEELNAWSGAADELKDISSNNTYHGVAIGSPLPSPNTNNPALGDTHSGTCGYASFNTRKNGSAFRIKNLPLDTSQYAQTSVSFWMHWDGTNSIMPIGWNKHDLWFKDGSFGFNTWNGDLYGMSSSGLSNGWHHVAAIFTNGHVTSNQLYIDGTLQTLSQQIGNTKNSRAYVHSNLVIGGVGYSTSYRFNGGYIDEVKVYSGKLNQSQVAADYTATHDCLERLQPVDNLALTASVATSFVSSGEHLEGVNDNVATTSSHVYHHDEGGPKVYGNWNGNEHAGETNWVSFEWPTSKILTEFQVLWWDNTFIGREVHVPSSAHVEYWNGSSWINAGSIGKTLHTFNALALSNVQTTKIRVAMSSAKATGIIEVRIFGEDAPDFDLIAEYHLDESSWNGTAGEIVDTASYIGSPFNGTTIGNPLASASNASPAIAGATGTCGYAELNGPVSAGGALSFNNIPFDTYANGKNSISFWLYWDGTDQVFPISSNGYSLAIKNNKLGFSATGIDIYGIDFNGTENGWHHIVAVFTQGDLTQNKLYLDGQLSTLTQYVANPRVQKAFFDAGDYYSGTQNEGDISLNSPWLSDNPDGLVQIHASSSIDISGPNRSLLDLERYSGNASNIKTTISTTPGDTVYVSFDTTERPNHYDSDVMVYIDNVLVATVGTNSLSMQHVEYSAITTSSSTLVELKSTDNNAYGPLVDDIKIETSANGSAQFNSTIQLGGSTTNTNQRLIGRVDEIKFYRGEVNQTQVTADYQATHDCPSNASDINASKFTCVALQEPSTSSGHLYMQRKDIAFTIGVVALKSDGTPETGFSELSDKNVTLQFVDQTKSNTPIKFKKGHTEYTGLTVTFPAGNDTGYVQVNDLNINAAYRNLKCQIIDSNQSPTLITQSHDNFSVRPSDVTLIKSNNADADPSNGANVSSTPTAKAGSSFNISASPQVANYDGSLNIDHSKLEAHTGAVQTGTLSGNFGTASPTAYGWAQNSFTYSEVGYFRFQPLGIYDATFSQVDINNGDCTDDFSNNAVNGKYGCKFGNTAHSEYIGRFVPDHLTITASSDTPACSGQFTYYGQDGLQTVFTMSAENSDNETLLNYTGQFAKFDLTKWNDFNFSATNLPTGASLQSGATAPSGTWHYGVASNVTATHMIAKQASEMEPKSVTINAQPSYDEGDAVNSQVITTISATSVATATTFRYGRLHLSNAYGSELHALSIPVEAQYWDGATYRKNTLDTCSTVNHNSVLLDCYSKNLNSGETTISGGGQLAGGTSQFRLSAPGHGNNGSVQITPYLSSAITSSCANGNSPNVMNAPWFLEANISKTPKIKATFGIQKSPIVYMRESF